MKIHPVAVLALVFLGPSVIMICIYSYLLGYFSYEVKRENSIGEHGITHRVYVWKDGDIIYSKYVYDTQIEKQDSIKKSIEMDVSQAIEKHKYILHKLNN